MTDNELEPRPIFSPVKIPQLHTEVLAQIKALIDDGTLSPGQALPSERDLSKQLGVSRNSLREALRVLEARGVIVTRHGVGRTVRDTSTVLSAGSLSSALETSTLLEVLEVRSALETVAVALACARATPEELERIQAASHPASADWEDTSAFHIAIAEASHNYVLQQIITDLMQLAGAIRQRDRYSSPAATEALVGEHAEITQAIADRDPNRAIDMMRQHLHESRQRVEGD